MFSRRAHESERPRRAGPGSRRRFTPLFEVLETRLTPSATYYVSPVGNDAGSGLSPGTAWRTIDRVNAQRLLPGETVRFQGGATFVGSLTLAGGDPRFPITFASYGSGRATIASGTARGLWASSAGGLHVVNLNFVGAGAEVNTNNGIDIANVGHASNFLIDQVDVTGYGTTGIALISEERYGMSQIRITRTRVHHNGNGINIGNGGLQRILFDVYLGHVEADHNNSDTAPMGGVGVAISNVKGGVIERSLFHDNGSDSLQVGHAGLLVYDSSLMTVQYNEAYGQFDPTQEDGQGIVFAGVTDSVIQYNYAHDNMNGGIQLTSELPAREPCARVTIRYNVLENNRSGLVVFHKVNDSDIYNNTSYAQPGSDGEFRTPLIVGYWEGTDLRIRNNIFQAAGGLPVVLVEETSLVEERNLLFQANVYHGTGLEPGLETYILWGAESFHSLPEFRAGTGQENVNGQWTGSTDDPGLANPGHGGTLGDPNALASLIAYLLPEASPLGSAGLDLRGQLGIDPGRRDYFGNSLPSGSPLSVGAHQPSANGPVDETLGVTVDQRFVSRSYMDLLGRLPDVAGLTGWTELLYLGGSRAEVVRGIGGSTEYKEVVVRELYRDYLGRAADAGGLNGFVTYLTAGGTVETVAAVMLGSREYFEGAGKGSDAGFLAALYRDALGRAPDPVGLAAFSGALAAGRSRQDIAAVVLASEEHARGVVEKLYGRLLGRAPDASGLGAFVDFLRTGGRREEVIVLIMASTEFFKRQ